MTYQEQLNPWVIHQLMPDFTQRAVSRFRRRTDAEAYIKIMKQMRPSVEFAIAFESSAATHSPEPKNNTSKRTKVTTRSLASG